MVNNSAPLAFRQIDADRSGGLNVQEFRQGRSLAPNSLSQAIATAGGGAAGAQAVFARFDSNKNGSLTGKEFADGLASLSRDSASAVLAAQEQQSAANRLNNSLKTSIYASLGSNVGPGGFTQQVLAAYGLK